jgi:outer membrane biosynthesis protein TonB
MTPLARNIFIGTVSALAAGLATVVLPLLNYALHGTPAKKDEPRIVAEVSVARTIEPPPPVAQPMRTVQQPQRARPAPSNLQPGPRFAMDLAVMGTGGAAAPLELVNRKSGSGGVTETGVDEKPSPTAPPPFRMPDEVRRREQDASLLLSFCVDASGRPYDIRVVSEKPPGLGMAAAGQEALRQTRFSPARKGNTSVPFCGLEQPFEIRFSN